MIKYFDNASISFPKPSEVQEYISKYLTEGGTYGRAASARNLAASRITETLRTRLANMFGIGSAERLVFTSGATASINTIIKGMDLKGKHVLISPLEHNAVMRPLIESGANIEILTHHPDGAIITDGIRKQIRKNTVITIVNQKSNVNGLIQPIHAIKQELSEIPLLVDASQSVGYIDINVQDIDFMAFGGHKGLMGPTGIGCLYIKPGRDIKPLISGGTGSLSDSYNMPSMLPDYYEAGTHNMVGIYGLLGALNADIDYRHSKKDFVYLIHEIQALQNYKLLIANDISFQGEVFSLNYKSMPSSELADILYSDYGIETRSGLHCSPLAHRTLGTFPEGAVRISLSRYHTIEDIDYLIDTLREIDLKY